LNPVQIRSYLKVSAELQEKISNLQQFRPCTLPMLRMNMSVSSLSFLYKCEMTWVP
jgi:hypothetical protein